MPIEIVGILSHREGSLTQKSPVVFDSEYLRLAARTLEHAGYDRALVAQSSFWPDSMPIATYVAAHTERLKLMVAHRPGFVAPTMAARQFATLDHLSNGRAGIHIISAANDAETQCDGDFLNKEDRYRRSAEFVEILRTIWTTEKPADYAGTFYKFNKALSEVRPLQRPGIPVFWGGTSDISLEKAARWADIYAFSLQSLDHAKSFTEKIQAMARGHGRSIGFQGGVRIILGATEELAWRNAHEIAAILAAQAEARRQATGVAQDQSVAGGRKESALSSRQGSASARVMEPTTKGEVIDKCLWTGTATASAGSNPPSLVGTPEQVADAILAYYDLGISGFMIRGFNMMQDAIEHGYELIPRLRAAVAQRDRLSGPAA